MQIRQWKLQQNNEDQNRQHLNVEFVDKPDGKYLKIEGKKSIFFEGYSDNSKTIKREDLKSLIIDRDEVFVNNLLDRTKPSLLDPRGENALTWNVFRTLTIANRWDILFESGDLITGDKILADQTRYQGKRPITYFWNIMPGSGHFNYHYARLMFYEEVTSLGIEFQVEPDFLAYFDNLTLYVEAKLKSGFSNCSLPEFMCRGKSFCRLASILDGVDNRSPKFTFGKEEDKDCRYFHQFLGNIFLCRMLIMSKNSSKPYYYLNILNEKSPHFALNLKKCREFAERLKNEKDCHIRTTSWQRIRETLAETIDKSDRNQRKLLVYLTKHPEL